MKTRIASVLAVAGYLAALGSVSAEQTATSSERVLRSAEGFAREHAADELRDPRTLEESRKAESDVRTKPRAAVTSRNSTVASASLGDSWIYEASTDVFADADYDGYFHYLRVRLDADSIYDVAYVYAEIYLSADGTTWEHLYTTDDFAVWGSDPEDDYEVETELVSGYSTGLYDVLIELYDADYGVLLDEYGPAESADFSMLPLEDSYRDGAIVEPLPPPHHHDGGGGAVGWWLLPGLVAAVIGARRRDLPKPGMLRAWLDSISRSPAWRWLR
jgi:hypothetical protein